MDIKFQFEKLFLQESAFDSIVEVRFRTYNLSIKRGGEYE